MPFGAVFTSSAGGDIGGGRLRTRFRGPILAGYASTADPGGQTMQSTANAAGWAGQPMYSYYIRPDTGQYISNASSSAVDMRLSVLGKDFISYQLTSQLGPPALALVSTAANTAQANFVWANGTISTAALSGFVFIPQTTGITSSSSGGAQMSAPTAQGSGAAMFFDAKNYRLWVYSSLTTMGWSGSAVMTSG